MTAGALVRHRACIVPLWLVSCYWCSVIATPVTKARYRFPCPERIDNGAPLCFNNTSCDWAYDGQRHSRFEASGLSAFTRISHEGIHRIVTSAEHRRFVNSRTFLANIVPARTSHLASGT